MNNTLIIFARRPELGKVKTRLAKGVGKEKALSIYSQLLEKTIDAAGKSGSHVKLYWSEGVEQGSKNKIQTGADLGERMYNALTTEFDNDKICLVGTDTPELSSTIITQAFNALVDADVVFGPSKDGGYYLVGTKTAIPKDLFINKNWSHQNVLTDALTTCKHLKLKVALLPTLLDIDTIDDYNEWIKTKE